MQGFDRKGHPLAVIDIEYGKEILAEADSEGKLREIKEMEMVLQNSSYGHEYAMMELQGAAGFLDSIELDRRLEEYKEAYFHAREYLKEHHPGRLETLEAELAEQKIKVFKTYNA